MTKTVGPLDRYTCEQVFRRLDEYVDRVLAPDEVARVEKHLATCVQCASEYRFEGALLEGLKNKIRQVQLPPSAKKKVESVLKANSDGETVETDDNA